MSRLKVFDAESIGQGAFSEVYKGKLDSTPVAVKRLEFRDDGKYLGEATILLALDHENIVKCFGIFANTEGTFDIVLELACGTLAGALYRSGLTTSWKRSTIHQISSGLAYMHGRGILHLDLKPPNILFKDRGSERVLIADFGMAIVASRACRAGALKFRAPDSPFTQKSDVFSLASIACCIFHERNPNSPEQTAESVTYVLDVYDFESNDAWLEALENGVDRDANIRPTAEQFRDAFGLSRAPQHLAIRIPEVGRAQAQGRTRKVQRRRSASRRRAERPRSSSKTIKMIVFILICGLILYFVSSSGSSAPDSGPKNLTQSSP